MKKCWKDVEHIEIIEGERGGRIWVLKLSCGHTVFRRIRPIRLHNLTAFKMREAPELCHCVCCADSENQPPAVE